MTEVLLLVGAIALLALGLWVPFVVAGAAIAIILANKGWPGMQAIGMVTWSSSNSFTLTAIPLFILMAEILLQSGQAGGLYRGLAVLTRRFPGGLLQTNIVGCALFSAISGSSVATAAAIGTVAIPELEKRAYPMRMAYGSLAAGGTLGILIPPSIAMIVYGAFTESSIVKLFAAGLIPGLVLTLLFSIYIAIFAPRRALEQEKGHGQKEQGLSARTVRDVLPVVLLIVLVLLSLYLGFATPTEAAALGVVGAFLVTVIFGGCTTSNMTSALKRTTRASGVILFIVVTAFLFSFAMAITGLSGAVAGFVVGLGLSKAVFLMATACLYIFLGLFIESIAMMVITVPLLAPALGAYGVDPIWFGVFLVILLEVGQITPPFGLNLFVVQNVNKADFVDVVMGTVPYYGLMMLMLLLLALFPELALWLTRFV